MARLFILLVGATFVLYGFWFMALPREAMEAVTGETLSTVVGAIDVRATYGGLSLGLGIVLAMLSQAHVSLGLKAVLLLMVCMAFGRTVGMLADGPPDLMMLSYLVLEVAAAVVALWLLRSGAADGEADEQGGAGPA